MNVIFRQLLVFAERSVRSRKYDLDNGVSSKIVVCSGPIFCPSRQAQV